MRILLVPALVLFLAGVAAPTPTVRAAAYIKFDGVDGEAIDPGHVDWIDVLSVQTGMARRDPSQGPELATLQVTKPLDKATPLLYQACAQGKPIPRAILELVREGPDRHRYYRIVLEDVIISSIQTAASPSEHPTEEVHLAYSKVTWTYTETDATGQPVTNHRAYWDLLRNEGELLEVPPFRVSGAQTEPGQLRLSWPAEAGQSYRIRSTADLGDSFADSDLITADSDGPIEIVLPVTGGHRFFFVEETR